MKKVYIIGSSGFLGQNLKDEFEVDHEILTAPSYTACSNYSSWQELICSDIRKVKPDIVLIPAASQKAGDDVSAIDELIDTNCKLPASVASTLLTSKISAQLIVFGTSWQHSDSENYLPFNLYAASKQANEDLLKHFALRGLKIMSIMLFDTYGEKDNRKKLLNLLLACAKTKTHLGLTPGDQEIDLVHINDVCKGVRQCIRELETWKPTQGVMKRGLGSGTTLTIKNLVDHISDTFQIPLNVSYGARSYREREVMTVFRNYTRPKNWSPRLLNLDFAKDVKK